MQLELPFHVLDGGKPEPYLNFRSKLDALDSERREIVDQKGEVAKSEEAVERRGEQSIG